MYDIAKAAASGKNNTPKVNGRIGQRKSALCASSLIQ